MAVTVQKARPKPDTTLPTTSRLVGHLYVLCMYAERLTEAPQSEVCRENVRLAVERARRALYEREER